MNLKVTLSLSVLAISIFAAAQGPDLSAFEGRPAPKFIMKDTAGKTLTNKSLLGKVVVLDFWATWCGPCKMASPAMQKLHQKYGSKGLVVIGADTFERNQPLTAAKGYASEHSYTYKFTVQNDGLAQSFGIQAIPAFVILDKKGVVRYTANGVPQSGATGLYAAFEPKIKKLLAER